MKVGMKQYEEKKEGEQKKQGRREDTRKKDN
jgi:hypothetical protein